MAPDADRPLPSGFLTPGRLEAFSDGVFAIAITLLVLELDVPTGTETLGRELQVGNLYANIPTTFSPSCLPFGGCLALVAALGILGSQFGFASLVAVLYPLFGYAALPFTGAILWKVCRGR